MCTLKSKGSAFFVLLFVVQLQDQVKMYYLVLTKCWLSIKVKMVEEMSIKVGIYK